MGFVIKSNASCKQVEFLPGTNASFIVEVKGEGLLFATKINDYDRVYVGGENLGDYFLNLFKPKVPWDGSIEWVSCDTNFWIDATCSQLGTITFNIRMIAGDWTDDRTELIFQIMSDLGALDNIAKEAKLFFQTEK